MGLGNVGLRWLPTAREVTSGTESLMFEATVDGLVTWFEVVGIAEGEVGT